MAYNSYRHSTTKVTPFELMHGREFRSPFDLPPPTTTLPEPSEFIRHQREYRRLAYQYVQQNIAQQQNQARQRYNANRRDKQYFVGDLVWYQHHGTRHKFDPRNIGPYEIIQKLGDQSYIIQHSNNVTDIRRVHINRLH
ncbi:unnamed protein product, partial [Didymodactylos carnosus]